MDETVILAIVAAILGQVGLSLTVLIGHARTNPTVVPLAVFLVLNGLVAAMPAAGLYLPGPRATLVALMPPAYLMLGPSLWFYAKGLTSETPWRFSRRDMPHLAPLGLGLVATVLILALNWTDREAIFFGQADDALFLTTDGQILFPGYVMIYLFMLVILWLFQISAYVAQTARMLVRYRKRLKDLFANNEDRELHWLTAILCLMVGLWLIAFTATLWDNAFNKQFVSKEASALLSLILVWATSLWGMRQKPGFEGRYQATAPTSGNGEASGKYKTSEKYRRSALTEDKAQRIADKVRTAMQDDKLYLDSGLSLQKLARHIGVSTNNLSQTLNETLGATFFDHVNGWRIEAAKPMVLAGEGTLLEISLAVGFNARSSFNKAFKHHTGLAPSDFRQQHKA